MNSSRAASAWWSEANGIVRTIVLSALVFAAPAARSQSLAGDAGWRNESLAQYAQRLRDLDAMVAACQAQRSAAHAGRSDFAACDPAQVGPNERVQLPAGSGSEMRDVRYDWLRSVLTRAEKRDGPTPGNILTTIPRAKSKQITVESLLAQARERLQADIEQTQGPAGATPAYTSEYKSLNAILSERAYQGATEVSQADRFREWLASIFAKFFTGLWEFGSRAPWIVWLLWGLLIAGVCTLLVWFLLRIERRSRLQLVPDFDPALGSPPAREWQLWYKDAGDMAARGLWRESIHSLYWASISLLESRRLWPPDRARTPREYLALVAGSDPHRPNLTALTRSFERTWYGGRKTTAADFDAALDLARGLGVAAE